MLSSEVVLMENHTSPDDPTFSKTVGSIYVSTSSIFILLQSICAYLMHSNKEMKNPTYRLMISLSVADAVELVPLGLYSGIVLIKEDGYVGNGVLARFMSFVCLVGWHTNCAFLPLIALSRWITMTRPYLVEKVFSKRNLRIFQLAPWIVFTIFCFFTTAIPYTNDNSNTFPFYLRSYTWAFDHQLPLGRYLHWQNFSINTICATVETWLNILSLKWVNDTRKSIHPYDSSTLKTRRREIKLLVQCFVIGLVFFVTFVTFTVVYAVGLGGNAVACLVAQALWMTNHSINPIVYLSVNRRLRASFLRLITCGWGKLTASSPVIEVASVGGGQRSGVR